MRTTPRAAVALLALIGSRSLRAQSTEPVAGTATGLTRTLAAIVSTPLGALAPVGPVMATNRDDKLLLGFRLQYGSHALPQQRTLTSYGLVTTLQIQGGALLSGTVGQQRGDAEICVKPSCDSHRLMAGFRYNTNIVTTRPFLSLPFFNKNDATGTAALELGAGWSNKGLGEKQHWTADITLPLSVAVGQKMRIVPFATPAFAVAWGTTDRRWSRGQRFLIGGGVTAQEVGRWINLTGLDVTVSAQRALSPFGTTFGATISWMHVP